jgi:hypothetical protein
MYKFVKHSRIMVIKVYSKRILVSIFSAGLLSLLLTSCVKSSNNINTNTNTPIAAVAFTQASPDENPLNIIINGTRINQFAFNYGDSSPYITLNAGKSAIVFSDNATAKAILTDTVNLVPNTNYSLFLINSTSNPGAFLLTDTLTKPTAGNAAIRFINLSPDAPAVDLVIKGGAVVVANKSYKGYSSFAPIPGNTATLEVHQAGTATVLATLGKVNFAPGYLYTIWFHGLAAGTTATDKLSVDIINNAYFL